MTIGIGRLANTLGILGAMGILVSCTGGFKAIKESSPSENPWSQGDVEPAPAQEQPPSPTTPTPGSGNNNSSGSVSASCSVQFSTLLARNEEFRIVVSSVQISKVQVSVNNSAYLDLNVANGTVTYPSNSFEVGSYNLKFQGLTSSKVAVACEPASRTLTIYSNSSLPTIPNQPTNPPGGSTPPPGNPPPDSGGTPPPANADKYYIPLVGYTSNGTVTDSSLKNFKDIYHPSRLFLVDVNASYAPGVKCYTLMTRHVSSMLGSVSSNPPKYRIFIPPGTKTFTMTAQTFWDNTTKQALAVKMDSAPQSSYEDALANNNFPAHPNTMRSLEQLYAGTELRSYVNESGNVLPRLDGGTDYSGAAPYLYQAPRGGWLHMHLLKVIGGVPMTLDTKACVDPDVYKAWYNSARWDADGNPI